LLGERLLKANRIAKKRLARYDSTRAEEPKEFGKLRKIRRTRHGMIYGHCACEICRAPGVGWMPGSKFPKMISGNYKIGVKGHKKFKWNFILDAMID